MRAFQLLAIATTVATYLLIVIGAVVRVTGSGLGCPDWPLCHGTVIPPLEMAAIIEYLHRLAGAAASALMLATAGLALWRYRSRRDLLVPAIAVPLLLAVQIPLGGVVVLLELEPLVVLVHLGFAMLILGALVWLAVASLVDAPAGRAGEPRMGDAFERWTRFTLVAAFLLILTGAFMRASGASWVCLGFPDCNGALAPVGRSTLVNIHLLHRFTAYAVAAIIGLTAWQAWLVRRYQPAVVAIALATLVLVLLQGGIGAAMVGIRPTWVLQALHVAGATAVWAAVVALACLAGRMPRLLPVQPQQGRPRREATPVPQGRLAQVVRDYMSLTKPAIIVLLLVTTVGAMLLAAGGLPPLKLLLFTLLGGALSSGGANAINCYIDRDIDKIMARTRHRPVPAGRIPPVHALAFGVALGALSFVILAVFVNLLAAVLALSGLLFYVFVYTRWLKRSTPSNIVIGGAAGAVPPLVGWAAVTGEVSLPAIFLFLVIFYWTPPHFWSLALLIKREYAQARVPMLPVVRGDEETRRQILLYTLLLLAITLALFAFRMMGPFYLLAALGLGGWFVYLALRLWREGTDLAARRVYLYSLLYLALLFGAMVLDQQLFTRPLTVIAVGNPAG
jgi:protoheme IX farnesyltransferase